MFGPLMAQILAKGIQTLETADIDEGEFNVVLGTFSEKQVDAKIKDDVDPFTEAKIKKTDLFPMLILPLPKKVYEYPDEENSTSWNHGLFNKWMKDLSAHLKLDDDIDIIGFMRFFHIDLATVRI